MYSKEAKKMVAEQIIGMISDNILAENGIESFVGWIEDGDAFYVSYKDKYPEDKIKEAIRLAIDIAYLVDNVSWELATERGE